MRAADLTDSIGIDDDFLINERNILLDRVTGALMTTSPVLIATAAVLALAFVSTGAAKVAAHPQMVRRAHDVGFDAQSYRVIGLLELAAAAGVLTGLVWAPLGIAASVGLVLLMLGATGAHLRARGRLVELVPAVVLGAVAIVYIVANT